MRELAAVCANEWMKLMRRRRFMVTAILSLFVVALFGVSSYHDYQNQLRYNPTTQLQQQVTALHQQIATLEGQAQSAQRDETLAQLKQVLAKSEQTLKQQQQVQSGDWKQGIQQQIADNQKTINQLKGSNKAEDVSQVEYAKAQIQQLQYQLDHNVRPLGWPTMNAYQTVTNFMSVAARIFLPLLVVILVADMISGEATDGTIKLLLIRPVSRAKILLGKWLVSLFATLIWSLALCAALLVTGFAIMGTRGGNQPIMTNVYYTLEQIAQDNGMPGATMMVAHYDHAVVMAQWQFLLTGFLYTALAMMVVATIAMLCSTIFKSAMVSTSAAMGSVIVGFIVVQMARHESWVNWLFPTHLNLMGNWTGELSQQLEQNVGLASGIVVLLAWAVVSLVISLVQFTRRDVLNA